MTTNNKEKYEALLSGFRIALMHKAHRVTVHTNSQLIARQIFDCYQEKELCISTYLEQVQVTMTRFDEVNIEHILCTQNAHADALGSLASATTAGIDDPITIEVIHKPRPPVEFFETHHADWMQPILKYSTMGQVLDMVKSPCGFYLKASHYTILDGTLYKRGFNVPLICCVEEHTAQ